MRATLKPCLLAAMKVLFLVAIVCTAFVLECNALSSELLRELASLKENALKQDYASDLGGDSDDGDDAMVKVMANALLGTIMEDGEDGDGNIMASIMNEDDKVAAQFFRIASRLAWGVARSFLKRKYIAEDKEPSHLEQEL